MVALGYQGLYFSKMLSIQRVVMKENVKLNFIIKL